MESAPQQPRRVELSPVGIFLVLLGTGFLLSRLGLVPLTWPAVAWIAVSAFGLTLIVRAAVRRQRNGVFIGSFLFFLGALVLARRWNFLESMPWDWPANLLLLTAAAFFVLYLFDPRRVGILAPVVFFGGLGTLYYLWWMDVLDLYDVRYYIRTYWPVLLILLGAGVMIKRRN